MFYRNGWVPLKLRPYGAIQICLLLLLLCPTLCYKEIQAPSKIKILPSETLVQTLDFENFATAYRSLAKCLWFSHNACIFKFHYTAPTSHYFLKLNYFKNIKFYYANQCVPRRHKSKHGSEWDLWRILVRIGISIILGIDRRSSRFSAEITRDTSA